MRKLFVVAALLAFALASVASALEFGSASDAKAMLAKVVAAMKADKAKTLEQITKGEGGFKDRDLYPYCGGPDGKFTAHPSLVGQSLKDLKDKAGKPFGASIYAEAKEGAIVEVPYMWPRPNSTQPVDKVALVTKVGDQVCAVGYYK